MFVVLSCYSYFLAAFQITQTPLLQVFVCENRLATINDNGSVLVWEKKWRTLCFQKGYSGEKLYENVSSEDSASDKGKKSKKSDFMEPELSEVLYENTKCTKEQISSCTEISGKEKCKDQEGMNKKLKVEHFVEKKDEVSSDTENLEISIAKVAIEDTLLLALDTGKGQHCISRYKFHHDYFMYNSYKTSRYNINCVKKVEI